MNFSFKLFQENNVSIFQIKGNLLDKIEAKEMLIKVDELLQNENSLFIFNFSKLSHLNSTGLNVFISLLTKIRTQGGDLIISEIPKKINQLLLITKLNTVFKTSFDNKEALEKLYKLNCKSVSDTTKL